MFIPGGVLAGASCFVRELRANRYRLYWYMSVGYNLREVKGLVTRLGPLALTGSLLVSVFGWNPSRKSPPASFCLECLDMVDGPHHSSAMGQDQQNHMLSLDTLPRARYWAYASERSYSDLQGVMNCVGGIKYLTTASILTIHTRSRIEYI